MSDVRVSAVTNHLDSLDRLFFFVFYSPQKIHWNWHFFKCCSCFVRLCFRSTWLVVLLACAFHVDDHISGGDHRWGADVTWTVHEAPNDVSIPRLAVCKCLNFQKLRTMSHPNDKPPWKFKFISSFGGGEHFFITFGGLWIWPLGNRRRYLRLSSSCSPCRFLLFSRCCGRRPWRPACV